MKRLLVIDDELGARESIRAIFTGLYEVLVAESAPKALELISRTHIDLILLDVIMPGMDGMVFLRTARDIFPDIPVIMISASFNNQSIEEARQLHAVGFICKPFDIHEIRNLTAQTLQAADSTRQQRLLQQEISRKFPVNVIGESSSIRQVMDAAKAASHTDASVLIVAEAGVGREHLARQIHSWSRRHAEPFVKLDRGGRDTDALNAELFGSVTDITGSKINAGMIDLIGQGSIYLNDVQNFPADTQKRIAAAIRQREFTRPGAPLSGVPQAIPHVARFFLACAPEHDGLLPELAACCSDHLITIPPLRERIEDIPILTMHYIGQLRTSLNARISSVEPEAMQKLQAYPWPGNVRELRNVIERILFLHGDDDVLRTAFLPKEISGDLLPTIDPMAISFHQATDQLHRQMIVSALQQSNGVIKNAARLLNVTPRILQHRIDKLKIDVRQF